MTIARACRFISLMLVFALIAGCSSKPTRTTTPSTGEPARAGGYYQDDGPGRNPPANLDQIADATPRWEPLHRFANRPYTVLGRDYVPSTELKPYRERGTASWYGRKFHQQKTSMGETYDMYAMTAAHPTLPLPSYVRVTNLANGRSVVVRVNDRGPFLHDRIIDLSFAAAQKLGYANQGSARVEVESLLPEGGGVIATRSQDAIPSPGTAGGRATAASVASVSPTGAVSSSAAALASSRPPLASSPTPLAAPPTPSHPLPLRIEGADVWLQLGAFSTLDNAENFLSLLEFQLAGESLVNPADSGGGGRKGAGMTYTTRVRSRDNLFRVELGPYASRDDAERAARELESRAAVIPPVQADSAASPGRSR